MSRDILSAIQSGMAGFSKGQKLIARYILENYDKAAFMTAAKLGQTVRISESTVVRFAAELGYDGYPAMQKAMQEMIRSKLTPVQRIEVSYDRLGTRDVLEKVVRADIEKLRMSLEELSREDFAATVEAIVGARRIYILGARSSSALADFLTFYFKLIFDNVCQVQASLASDMFEQLLRVGEGDVASVSLNTRQIVLHPLRAGPGVRPGSGGHGGGPHRQRAVPSVRHRQLPPAGEKRHGVLCRLAGGPFVGDQRADRGGGAEEVRRGHRHLPAAGADLGRIPGL